jgi:DNA-directed RNA polymerase subunit RPC12/RpoP
LLYWRTKPPKQKLTDFKCVVCGKTYPVLVKIKTDILCGTCLKKVVAFMEDRDAPDWVYSFIKKPDAKYYEDVKYYNKLPDHFGQGDFINDD